MSVLRLSITYPPKHHNIALAKTKTMSAGLTQRFSQLCASALRLSTSSCPAVSSQLLHTSAPVAGYEPPLGPRRWLKYNQVMYEPQAADETPRPAVSMNEHVRMTGNSFWGWFFAVRLPSNGQHQVQSLEDVVHRINGPGNDCRRGAKAVEFCPEKGSHSGAGHNSGGAANGCEAAQCRIQE